MLKPTSFPYNHTDCKCQAITEQSERQSFAEGPTGVHTSRKCFGPFLNIQFNQNMVASNIQFGYQMLSQNADSLLPFPFMLMFLCLYFFAHQ